MCCWHRQQRTAPWSSAGSDKELFLFLAWHVISIHDEMDATASKNPQYCCFCCSACNLIMDGFRSWDQLFVVSGQGLGQMGRQGSRKGTRPSVNDSWRSPSRNGGPLTSHLISLVGEYVPK
jgi:hypothetical protein